MSEIVLNLTPEIAGVEAPAIVLNLQLGIHSTEAETDLAAHLADLANPHSVTKTQVGLGNADNTSDVNKPVSTAQAAADNLRILLSWLDTDVTLANNSDERIATQKAIKAYVDALLGAQNAFKLMGSINASTNPNYPAANAAEVYIISVAGKIGGVSGPDVEAGDVLTCIVDGTIAGTHAAVGTSWVITQGNIVGAVTTGGGGTMTVPLAIAPGTVSLPGLPFAGDLDTGIWSPGANIWAVGVGGVETFRASSSGTTFNNVGLFTSGTASLPGISFSNDTNTGIYGVSADVLGVTAGGVQVQSWGVGTSTLTGNLLRGADNTYDEGALGANRVRNYYAGTSFIAPLGAVGTPSYSFAGDSNTGLWSPAADTWALSAGVVETIRGAATKVTLTTTALWVGERTVSNSDDAKVIISRSVDNTIAGNGHAFSDSSDLNRIGTVSYNSYDARITVSGSYNYGHYAAFQSGPSLGTSGTITDLFNFVSAPTITAGTVTNSYGIRVQNPVKTGLGVVTNNYGVHLPSTFDAGSSSNYAWYNASAARSWNAGTWATKQLFVSLTDGTPDAGSQVHVNSNDGTAAKLRIQQQGQNYWDIASPASSIDLTISSVSGERFRLSNAGVATLYNNLLFSADNSFDIGASGANRARNAYIGSALAVGTTITTSTGDITSGARIVATTSVQAGSTNAYSWSGRAIIRSPADGQITLLNAAENSFTRLNFGGVTAAEVALKRVGAGLQVRTGDDGSMASFEAAGIDAYGSLRMLSNTGAIVMGATPDIYWYRDAAGTPALRNGTNAQTLNIYASWSNAGVDFEGMKLRALTSSVDLIAMTGGTGGTRPLRFGINNNAQWQVNTSGHWTAVTDATYDAGSASNQIRDAYLSRYLRIGGAAPAGAAGLATIQAFGNTWSVIGGNPLTDTTAKVTAFGSLHYTNSEEPSTVFCTSIGAASAALNIGGGTASGNAMMRLNFYTAPSNTTTTGTARWQIDENGVLFPVADATTDVGYASQQVRDAYLSRYLRIGGAAPAGASGLSVIQAFGKSWATIGGDNLTDATAKGASWGVMHYTNSQAPLTVFYGTVTVSASSANIGGGTSSGNAATDVNIFTAANNTTITGTKRWLWDGTGHFYPAADNTYDGGWTGGRIRNLYVGSAVSSPNYNVTSGDGTSNGGISAAGDGIFRLVNGAGTNFTRLVLGPATNAFPALRRTGTSVEAVLGDNSAYTGFNADNITAATNRAITAGGIVGVGFKLSTTTNFGVFFGSGAPTLSAAKGSWYLRSDGTTTNDRAYVNTDGGTTWTPVITLA